MAGESGFFSGMITNRCHLEAIHLVQRRFPCTMEHPSRRTKTLCSSPSTIGRTCLASQWHRIFLPHFKTLASSIRSSRLLGCKITLPQFGEDKSKVTIMVCSLSRETYDNIRDQIFGLTGPLCGGGVRLTCHHPPKPNGRSTIPCSHHAFW